MNFQDIPEKCPICYKKLLQEKRGDDTIYHYCENKCFSGCLVGYSEDLNKIFPTCLSCGNIITSHLYHYSHGGKVWIELGHCGCWYER